MEKIATALPLDFHPDGTPIFERGDIVRDPRPIKPNGEVYENLMLPEHRHLRPEIRFNMHVIKGKEQEQVASIWLGKSYPDQRRGYTFGRIIQALDSTCRVILQRWEQPGYITDFLVLNMAPLQLAPVPPTYEAILANASASEPARFFEIQAWEEVRNTDTIENLEGSGYLLYTDGRLLPNANYDELPIPRIHPGQNSFDFLQRRPLYEMLTHYPKGFDFIDPPRDDFFAGSV